MRFLSIKNLKKHQHYKDRRPPWIKLHAEVLDDYAFTCLQDASKAHLMLLWVLASRMDNRIPYDLAWITQKLGANTPLDLEELILQGFIEVSQDDSTALAPRKQSAMPETEAERETEAEYSRRTRRVGGKPARPVARPSSGFDLAPYIDAHREAFPGSTPPAGRYGRVFKQLEAAHGRDEVLRRFRICLAVKRTFGTPEELAAHWSEYGEAPAAPVVASTMDALRREYGSWIDDTIPVPAKVPA
jgi:hypothetical protein